MKISLDHKESSVNYWASQPTDQPHTLNGFKGTWAFSDHELIPGPIREFLIEHYHNRLGELRRGHIKTIPLNEINELMNSVWDGPGSMPKICSMMFELRSNRINSVDYDKVDPLKDYQIPTIESNLVEETVDSKEE
jgi:hypothetical protein